MQYQHLGAHRYLNTVFHKCTAANCLVARGSLLAIAANPHCCHISPQTFRRHVNPSSTPPHPVCSLVITLHFGLNAHGAYIRTKCPPSLTICRHRCQMPQHVKLKPCLPETIHPSIGDRQAPNSERPATALQCPSSLLNTLTAPMHTVEQANTQCVRQCTHRTSGIQHRR